MAGYVTKSWIEVLGGPKLETYIYRYEVGLGDRVHDVTLILGDVLAIPGLSFLIVRLHVLGPFQQGN